MAFQANTTMKRVAQGILMAATMMALEVSIAPRLLDLTHVHAQAAPDDLPDAPNKALVVKKCTQCHSVAVWASQRRTQKSWDETIAKMQDKGLVVTDDEYDKILTYLSTNLAPPPAPSTPPAAVSADTSH